jgi:hypothetical protein
MLEVVRDRVESIYASQYAITEELRDIKANLPLTAGAVARKNKDEGARNNRTGTNALRPRRCGDRATDRFLLLWLEG